MKKLIWIILLLATTSMWAQTQYNPGTTVTSLNAVSTTGAGTTFNLLNQSSIPAYFTWSVVVNGGTASAITTILQGCMDAACTTTYTMDTSTSTSGETRSVANKPVPYVRCDITSYTTNGTTATCKFVAMYGAGIPAPTAASQCLVSQGTFQGAWVWAACSGAGGTVTTSGSPIATEVAFFSSPTALTGATTLEFVDPNLTVGGTVHSTQVIAPLVTATEVDIDTSAIENRIVSTVTSTRVTTLPDADSNTVRPSTCATHNFSNGIASTGIIGCAQPAPSDLSVGALPNGTTATTQAAGSSDTKVATDAYVNAQTAIVTTANQGSVWMPTISYPPNSGISTIIGSANQQRYIMIVLPFQITISHITVFVGTKSASASQQADFGIYSADGTTLLVHTTTGGVDVSSGITNSTAYTVASNATVTLNPGPYIFAWTCTDAAVTFGEMPVSTQLSGIQQTQTVKKQGQGGNSADAGVLHSSLGTLTTAFSSTQIPVALFEP